jgi:shikimate kinase
LTSDTPKNIALTGFMAVGKSAVGRRLAQRLRAAFVDLDRAIEEREGMPVGEIFATKGEPYFRSLEKRLLMEILERDGQVIATGGGAVLDEENLRLLKKKSRLICLTAEVEKLLQRAGSGKGRPLLNEGNRRERIEELMRRRRESYRQAELTIDTTGLTIDGVVEKIIAYLSLSGAST